MQGCFALDVLMVNVSSSSDEEFAGCDLALENGEEKWSHFFVVFSIDVTTNFNHLSDHKIHPLKARHMQRTQSILIGLILVISTLDQQLKSP